MIDRASCILSHEGDGVQISNFKSGSADQAHLNCMLSTCGGAKHIEVCGSRACRGRGRRMADHAHRVRPSMGHDALVGSAGAVQFLDFDRDAASPGEAVLSAVADAERVEGVQVRVADAGLASMADIAARTGRTREGVRLLVSGACGPGGFRHPSRIPGAGTGYGAGPMSSAGSGANSAKMSRRHAKDVPSRPSTPASNSAGSGTGWMRRIKTACGRLRSSSGRCGARTLGTKAACVQMRRHPSQ